MTSDSKSETPQRVGPVAPLFGENVPNDTEMLDYLLSRIADGRIFTARAEVREAMQSEGAIYW